MDIQLQELLTKIKEDGIAKVTAESAEMLEAARKEAEGILTRAKTEARAMQERAAEDIQQREASSRQSLQNAARDLILAFERQLKDILDRIIDAKVADALTGDALKKLIVDAVSQNIKTEKNISVVLPKGTKTAFVDSLKKALQSSIRVDVPTSSDDQLIGGFQIAYTADDLLIDYSYDHIKNEFIALVNPYLKSIIGDL